MQRLRSRLRAWTLFFIAGLVVSGATALPIRSEVEAGVAVSLRWVAQLERAVALENPDQVG